MRLAISGSNVSVQDEIANLVERRMRFALTRFGSSITDVSVTLTDESGPHGPPARKCKVLVRLRAGGSIVVESLDESYSGADMRAAGRANGAVSRQLKRRQHAGRYQRRRQSPQTSALAE